MVLSIPGGFPVYADAEQHISDATQLVALAEFEFDDISAAEIALFRAVADGRGADYSTSNLPTHDHHDPALFSESAVVRADRIRWLLADAKARPYIGHYGVYITGARIIGELDLAFLSFPFPLAFTCCYFDDPVVLQLAVIPNILFDRSSLNSLLACGISVAGLFQLRDNCEMRGSLDISFGNFGVEFSCRETTFLGMEEAGIILQGVIAGRISLSNLKIMNSYVDMMDSVVVQSVDLRDIECSVPEGVAVHGRNLHVGTDLIVAGCQIEGGIDLSGADINGSLIIADSTVSSTHNPAIEFSSSEIGGYVQFGPNLTCDGDLRAVDATLGGSLFVVDVSISTVSGFALDCGGIRVAGSVAFSETTNILGAVILSEAKIGGGLTCTHASFTESSGVAIVLDQAEIGASIYFDQDCRVRGALSMTSTLVKNSVLLEGEYDGIGQHAISGYGLQVGDSMYLRAGFRCEGVVSLKGVIVTNSLFIEGFSPSDDFMLDLRGARVGCLADQATSWPTSGGLFIEGFEYDTIDVFSPISVEERLDWIERQPSYLLSSQPYEQLALVMEGQGNLRSAKLILIAKAKLDSKRTHWLIRPFERWIYGGMLGYGYYPFRIVWLAIGLICINMVMSKWQIRNGLLTESNDNPPTVSISPFLYSLDLLIPIVDLHQVRHWKPTSSPKKSLVLLRIDLSKLSLGRLQRKEFVVEIRSSLAMKIMRSWFCFMILMGWTITTVLVLAVSGILGL